MVKQTCRIYGVLGYPVKHSLSPLMHNAAFRALKINAQYCLFEVSPKKLKDFFLNLKEKNIFGLNVTIPYKEKVIPFLDKLSDEAKLIKAVNTIVRTKDDKLIGFNTDGEGFLRHLRSDLKFNPYGKKIAILGAGGASRAILVYLARTKPKIIKVYDIVEEKAKKLINYLKKIFKNIDFKVAQSILELDILDADLLINATPVGMKETDPVLVKEEFLHKNLLVYDLIYNPVQTKLLASAKKRGARASNGLGMLLYQGMASFEHFTQKKAPLKIMKMALEAERSG